MASLNFKPHPCNFWICMIFCRFSNDISNIFLYLHCMNRTELRSSSEKISKFKRAWQVQISRYTHVTLRKYAFLKNNQMILVSFSCIFNTSLKITSVCSTNTLSSPCISLFHKLPYILLSWPDYFTLFCFLLPSCFNWECKSASNSGMRQLRVVRELSCTTFAVLSCLSYVFPSYNFFAFICGHLSTTRFYPIPFSSSWNIMRMSHLSFSFALNAL